MSTIILLGCELDLGFTPSGGDAIANCVDGVLNGDETGIDCGGPCAPCSWVTYVTDGAQNEDIKNR